MIAVTGATGKLGRHVIEGLLQRVPARQIVMAVRSPEKAADFARRGVQVRRADYGDAGSLDAALAGAEKLLLISSSALGQREVQHRAVIDAARRAGVRLLVYTSLLHADTAASILAVEHRDTETYLRASGVPWVVLRNGWYLENYTESLAPALQHGALLGSSGSGRVAAAARADYAAAAVAVLLGDGHAGKTYELAGDRAFTMAELAEEVGRQARRAMTYRDMPTQQYQGVLEGFGLPTPVAAMLADASFGAQRGELDDRSGALHALIARPTTPLAEAVAAALPPPA